MKPPLAVAALACLGAAFILCTYQYLFGAEITFLSVRQAGLSGPRVHMLIEGKRQWYAFGDSKTLERQGFLLDYDLRTEQLTLFELTPDASLFNHAFIMDNHQLLAHLDQGANPHNPSLAECWTRSLQLDAKAYSWSPAQRCQQPAWSASPPNSTLPINGNTADNDKTLALSPPSPSPLSRQPIDRITPSLFFIKPETAGAPYRIVDADERVLAEKNSPTDEATTQSMQIGLPFSFPANEPLLQMPANYPSRALGVLPTGEVLLAFEFVWAAERSIVLIAWDVQNNATRLAKRIYYESLFSPTQFQVRRLGWWAQLKYFVLPKRRPIVPVQSIPSA